MRRIFDLTNDETDLVFRDNNWTGLYAWNQVGSADAEAPAWLAGVAYFGELWCPEDWQVDISPLVEGVPMGNSSATKVGGDLESLSSLEQRLRERINREVAVLESAKRTGEAADRYGLAAIQSSVGGWSRIAIPEGASSGTEWKIVCPDSLYPREYDARPAPPMDGTSTLWLRMKDAQHASSILLSVDHQTAARLRVNLGLSFFNPSAETRPPGYLIKGVAIEKWQAAHQEMLSAIEQALFNYGWAKVA